MNDEHEETHETCRLFVDPEADDIARNHVHFIRSAMTRVYDATEKRYLTLYIVHIHFEDPSRDPITLTFDMPTCAEMVASIIAGSEVMEEQERIEGDAN